mgnify:CR=1 FL=1
MRDRALMAICAAVIIATAVGLIASRPRGRERISGPICGRVGYPHYASQKITEAEMWKRARFRILEPKVPEGWHLVEIRQMRGEDLQGFVLYYDTDPAVNIEDASVMVFETQTGRTREMEKAFVQRLIDMKLNVTVEKIAGHDVVFDAAGVYFMQDGVLYDLEGPLYAALGPRSSVIRSFVQSMAEQIRAD